MSRPFEHLSYDEMMARVTYTILRTHRDLEGESKTVEASGLSLEAARARSAELTAEYARSNPGKTAWSSDLFLLYLEEPYDYIGMWISEHKSKRWNTE